MSEDEVESFEISDYDLENAFNPGRSFRGLSKNQQIYGMWADNDSGDEGPSHRPGFGRPSGTSRKPKNYTAPVAFVAGGIQQAGKDKEKKDESDNEEEDEANEEDGMTKSKLGIDSSESSEGEEVIGSSFSKVSINNIDGDIAGLRKKRPQFNPALTKKGVGQWERHTKGIGAKLLLQMGYQPGKGLGKDLQGIHAPIEAHLRKGRGAIGAYGPEKAQKIAELEPDDKTSKEGKKEAEKLSQWRKEDGTSKKKKVRYVYKSIEDVLEQSKQPGKRREFSELSKVKVIDMTGPEQRVLSGYHAISSIQRPSDQWEIRKDKKFVNFELPELQHNLNLLVDMCEEAIVANDRSLRYSEDTCVALEAEIENLTKIEQQEALTIDALDKVMAVVQKLVTGSEDNTLTLQEAAESFVELQQKYYSEYCAYELSSLATGIVRPLLKDSLSAWSPLQEPEKPIPVFQQWKSILEQDQAHTLSVTNTQDPYHRLLWDAWMPCVRIAVNAWQCRKCEPMIDFLDKWIPMIPGWILENILQQLILPRLQHDVEEWNPVTDTLPIHTWIHPWLPLLGKYLGTTIFPIIRHKLSSALLSWHPSDCSARLMLQPWVGVFNKGEMDAFLINNIVPKLHLTLQEFVINPHQQHLDNWNWVMEWAELLPVHVMASLLDKSFFPKWLQVLTLWLNLTPNYDQVTNWYTGWKSMISEPLMTQPVVKEHFRSALDLMNRAVGGGTATQPPPPPPPPPPEPQNQQQARFQGMAECVRTATQIPQGFKDLVQKRCAERGIIWMPLPNRFREAKQIYRCGNLQVYISRNVLFACDSNGLWSPISINELLEKAA